MQVVTASRHGGAAIGSQQREGTNVSTYYLALEPPARDLGRLSLLMRRLGDTSPLPHVTVIEPPLLSCDLSWMDAARDVAAHSQPIDVSLAEPRTFGDRVLYLAVDAPELTELRCRLLGAISPAGDESCAGDLRPYVPHLTLVVARHGGRLPTYNTLDPKLLHVDTFTAFELTLFRHEDDHRGYRAWRRFPLNAI